MSVDFDRFLEWAIDQFGEHNVRVKHTAHGTEITTHSLWSESKIGKEDRKYKLWMSPEGGKKGIEHGVYRCWLTDTMGSLVSLVSELDGIPFDEAEEFLTGTTSLRALEKQVHEFFGHKEAISDVFEDILEVETEEEPFPDFTFLIDTMSPSNHWRVKARRYLAARKIPAAGLHVCTMDEKYGNRIVIPYYDQSGNRYFWNARAMDDKNPQRYVKPEEGDQANVLFMTTWPEPGTRVYIMEGELDAISLSLGDLVGCACGGKFLSEAQIEMLRGYKPVLAFDSDEAGGKAMAQVGNALLEAGFPTVYYVRPPVIYKDWNKLLVERNIHTVRAYVDRFEKRFTPMTADWLLSLTV
jgi:DNA primase